MLFLNFHKRIVTRNWGYAAESGFQTPATHQLQNSLDVGSPVQELTQGWGKRAISESYSESTWAQNEWLWGPHRHPVASGSKDPLHF